MKKSKVDNVLIADEGGTLHVLTEPQFNKFIKVSKSYTLIGTIRPRFSKRYLTKEQKDFIIKCIESNPGKFHYLSQAEIIENVKKVIFKSINND